MGMDCEMGKLNKSSKIDEPSGSSHRAYIVLQDQVYPIKSDITLIGRRLTNHLVLEDRRVSRTHAQIRVHNNQFMIVDLNSTGGTYVNGEPVSQCMLFTGDEISIAGSKMVFIQDNEEFEKDSEKYTHPHETKFDQGEKTKPKKPPE